MGISPVVVSGLPVVQVGSVCHLDLSSSGVDD